MKNTTYKIQQLAFLFTMDVKIANYKNLAYDMTKVKENFATEKDAEIYGRSLTTQIIQQNVENYCRHIDEFYRHSPALLDPIGKTAIERMMKPSGGLEVFCKQITNDEEFEKMLGMFPKILPILFDMKEPEAYGDYEFSKTLLNDLKYLCEIELAKSQARK